MPSTPNRESAPTAPIMRTNVLRRFRAFVGVSTSPETITASMMPSGNSCADASGSGYINAVTPFADMLAAGKSYFDLDGDGSTDDTGTSGNPTGSVKTSGMPTLPLLMPGQLRYQTSAAGGGGLNKGRPQWNRVSWRELRND